MKKQNIVLVGFRGSGKTMFGSAMAELIGMPFADLDAEVEFLIGQPIFDFVEKYGWQVFREVEQRVTHDFSRHFSGIISTGGGTIENSKNLQTLKRDAAFVFLHPEFMQVREYLLKTDKDKKRPRLNPDLPLAMEIDQLWSQRKGIYNAVSDVEVEPDLHGKPAVEARKILGQLPANFVPNIPPRRKVVVMSSSGGTTIDGLLERQKLGRIPNVEFTAFITDKPNCGALGKAKKGGIPRIEVLEPRKGEDPEEYDRAIMNILREEQPDYILLAGYMRILSPLYCDNFGDITLNAHPSLLPEYAGMMSDDIHEAVLTAGDKYTGATIHRVTAELDAGEIVVQRKVVVQEDDAPKSLKWRVQQQEVLGFCEVLERR